MVKKNLGGQKVHQLNMELTQLMNQLEDKRKRGEELNQMKKENQQQYRWQAPVEELDLSTLEQLKSAMEGLKKNLFYMRNSSGDGVIHDQQTNNNNTGATMGLKK
ncbi:hypothetical protein GQ457_14G023830 [Hibiscus cannabinus]